MDDPTALLPLATDSERMGLVCVGRLDANKGQDVIIRALKLLTPEFPSLTVEFIGDGSHLAGLIELARDQGVLEHCRFSGHISHAKVFVRISRAWFTLVPSRNEAFGRVVVESLALGVPVIASNVGGIPEIVRDGVDGWLVPLDDPIVWADRIAQLLRDPYFRQQMGANGRQRFLTTFEQSVHRDRLVSWLETQVATSR